MSDPQGAPRRRHTRRRTGIGLVVLAAHGIVAIGLTSVVATRHTAPAPARVSVRLLPPAPDLPRAPAVPSVRVEARAAAAPPARRAATIAPAISTPNPPATGAPPTPSSGAETPIYAAASASAASGAEPAGDLLDSPASRRAIRQAARSPGLAARTDAQVGVHSPTAAQQLPSAVRQAGKGDCAKGEYAGAGMGLLSAPFLLIAVAGGDCAQ